jgi:hypothetical protein
MTQLLSGSVTRARSHTVARQLTAIYLSQPLRSNGKTPLVGRGHLMLTGEGTVAPKVALSNDLIGLNYLNVLNDSSEA